MNSCCALPVEQIAADKHKEGGECCLVIEQTPAPPRAACPVSQTSSRKVQRRTLEHLLKPEKITALGTGQYYYCAAPQCDVVYFSPDDNSIFTTGDVSVKVFSKDSGDDVDACYCYDWTRGRIKRQIAETGGSTAAMEIAREVKVGNCQCDIKNPKGECCLGEVNAVVKTAIKTKNEYLITSVL